jgi:Ca2+-binding RTX toxin-like protein
LRSTSATLGEGLVYIASRPLDGTIVALVPDGQEFREIGLYWPTPTDPVYAYRRMSRLPRDTTFLGNEYDQTIVVLRERQEFVVGGVSATYRPINYNGYVLSIDGCAGDDDIEGGNGSDHLFDYAGGRNRLNGYGGRDWLEGNGTVFIGGEGDDCITGDGGSYFADISGNEGDDVLESTGSYGATAGGEGTDSCSSANVDECETVAAALCLGWI